MIEKSNNLSATELPSKKIKNCTSCTSCGWEPDADYPICYNKKVTDESMFGLYVVHEKCIVLCIKENYKYWEQHPLRNL